ncbi:hypothetical protein HMPREF1861_01643 [Corynebacterium kroppenstedtii]|nr:hypothetical protein HMPREF1861_01643 [Corynebacterium kroppenstedtii]
MRSSSMPPAGFELLEDWIGAVAPCQASGRNRPLSAMTKVSRISVLAFPAWMRARCRIDRTG